MRTYRLTLSDGTPADPPTFRTVAWGWRIGDTIRSARTARRSASLEMRNVGEFEEEWVVEDAGGPSVRGRGAAAWVLGLRPTGTRLLG